MRYCHFENTREGCWYGKACWYKHKKEEKEGKKSDEEIDGQGKERDGQTFEERKQEETNMQREESRNFLDQWAQEKHTPEDWKTLWI